MWWYFIFRIFTKKKLLSHSFQISHTFLESFFFLFRSDGFSYASNNPINHVLLFSSPQNVGNFQLVVQPFLNLKIENFVKLTSGIQLNGTCTTVWKFQDFSVIHILREINFDESILPLLGL